MSLQDKIAADQAAIAAAQAALDAANAALTQDQASLAALQPTVAAINEIKTFAAGLSNADEAAQLTALADAALRALDL